MIEWNFGEEMMDDMKVDDFVEKVSANETNTSVDRSHRSLSKRPGFIRQVRYIWVRMVKIGYGHCDEKEGQVSR